MQPAAHPPAGPDGAAAAGREGSRGRDVPGGLSRHAGCRKECLGEGGGARGAPAWVRAGPRAAQGSAPRPGNPHGPAGGRAMRVRGLPHCAACAQHSALAVRICPVWRARRHSAYAHVRPAESRPYSADMILIEKTWIVTGSGRLGSFPKRRSNPCRPVRRGSGHGAARPHCGPGWGGPRRTGGRAGGSGARGGGRRRAKDCIIILRRAGPDAPRGLERPGPAAGLAVARRGAAGLGRAPPEGACGSGRGPHAGRGRSGRRSGAAAARRGVYRFTPDAPCARLRRAGARSGAGLRLP